MKFGIIGTGDVAGAIATKLVTLGHEVNMGARSTNNEKAKEWSKLNGALASQGTFKDAASFGDIIFNCTGGAVSLDALEMAGSENLSGKVLVDIANPLVRGEYLSLVPSLSNTTSLGEEIQKKFSDTKVVKTLNTMHYSLMVEPSLLKEKHDVFVCSDHEDAKEKVKEILNWFGWEAPVDLGKLPNARYTEMLSTVWRPVFQLTHDPIFAFKIVRN
ncbi:hypothetical protein SAMN05444008_1129 [Cnuella takakiae]|uniref:Pyrroline-5-carboxylate reductase catalytic N-terminal domain-containing protein n=1 Tax=Cnuella takakiae TaxID=1302690 RepID=A0A1M5EE07_9BACT|nr:NAD(P)-binding domain-containing protein [Cnuella takakiae]OLY91148.1 hypothetical protein BUE76_03950 [Cnuella takakiae]SHF77426.1 hypothetical protein SAMN05444008_1129 [Cnuella takakiae]